MHSERGPRSTRFWLSAGLVLVGAATVALVFSEDVRWLRLGIVAALWAALLAAFLATAQRRRAEDTRESMDEAQRVYELELEREIAARREYELEVEADARERAEYEARAHLDALRDEVAALRETLQQLVGAEVLYERVALTAQSTRMRSLGDGYAQASGTGLPPGREPEPNGVRHEQAVTYRDALSEQRTELIARVLGAEQARREEPRMPHPDDDFSGLSLFTPQNEPRQPAEPPRRRAERPRPEFEAPEPPTPDNGDLSAVLPPELEEDWTPSWERYTHEEGPQEFRAPASSNGGHHQAPEPEEQADNSTLPQQVRDIQRQGRPGGRRRKPDTEPQDAFAMPATGGRHSKPHVEPEPEPEPEEPTGSHSHGRSVSDLLAAYGNGQSPRRRRGRS